MYSDESSHADVSIRVGIMARGCWVKGVKLRDANKSEGFKPSR